MLLRPIFAAALAWPAMLWAAPDNPADPQADAPPLIYQSPFISYQSMQDDAATPDKTWREANDRVGRIGGHAGYLRNKQETNQAPDSSEARPHHAH